MAEGLRERKKQETREALSWAATRLVVARGYGAVRIEDIADEAGVSLRTFRNYFGTKAEAITARHLDRILLIADELRSRPADEPIWTAVLAAVEARFAMGMEDAVATTPAPEWLAGLRLMVTEPAVRGEMHRVTALAAAEVRVVVAERVGADADDLYPQLVAAVVGTALGVAMEHWIQAEPSVAFTPLLREVFQQIAAGLPAPDRGA